MSQVISRGIFACTVLSLINISFYHCVPSKPKVINVNPQDPPTQPVQPVNPAVNPVVQPVTTTTKKSKFCGGTDTLTKEEQDAESAKYKACLDEKIYTDDSCVKYTCMASGDADPRVKKTDPVKKEEPSKEKPVPTPANFDGVCTNHPVPDTSITELGKFVKLHGDAKGEVLDSYKMNVTPSLGLINTFLAEIYVESNTDNFLVGRWEWACDNYLTDDAEKKTCHEKLGLKIKTPIKCGACIRPCVPQ